MKPLPLRLLVGGLIVTFGSPIASLFVTVIGMMQAFHTLGANGISNPDILAAHIGTALIATWTGLMIALVVGLPLIIAGAIIHFSGRNQQPRAKP